MQVDRSAGLNTQSTELASAHLLRQVKVDFYNPPANYPGGNATLLLINDGQDLVTMDFSRMLYQLYASHKLQPLVCVGIHCGEDRRNEYGMAGVLDYKGRGTKAVPYQKFVLTELLPLIKQEYAGLDFKETAFAGFSMGGLSAMDMVWSYPEIFTTAGIFSGSLWWRSRDKSDKLYSDSTDRLMHQKIRAGVYHPGQRFFFQTGELDEGEDRNHNGVIDSIDDTIDLMRELLAKGYREGKDLVYLQMADGRHDVPTWARALPVFLEWAWPAK